MPNNAVEQWYINHSQQLRNYYDINTLQSSKYMYIKFRSLIDERNYHEYLDGWIFRNNRRCKFTDMTTKEIKEAIRQIEKGWTCLGQQGKIISLKKELESRRG